MRPLRLELKGFSTFKDSTVVDFEDLDLVAFVGPTGAGKSTIIDGIGFALYGSVSRYKNTSLVAPIINQLSHEARVRLDFSIAGKEFTAVRVVRRTSAGATTKEARLESGGTVLAGTAGELRNAVEDLLGLDFDQFTKTVVLPQGEFARFLTEASGDRQGLLRRLLGMDLYRAIGMTARDRARTATARRDALVEQEDAVRVSDADLSALVDRSVALERLEPLLVRSLSNLAEAEGTVAEAESAIEQNEEAIDRLAAIDAPADAKSLSRELNVTRVARSAARETAEAARADLALAERAVADHSPLHELEGIATARNDRIALSEKSSALEPEMTLASTAFSQAVEASEKADSLLGDLANRLGDARISAGAGGLVAMLEVGAQCPVCRRTVESIPDHDLDAELSAAEAAHDAARLVKASADAEERDAQAGLERVRAQFDGVRARIAELDATLTNAPDKSKLADAISIARAAAVALESSRTNASRALDDLQEKESILERLEKHTLELRVGFTAIRDDLADLDPPAPGESDIGRDWKEFTAWSRSNATERRARRRSLQTELRAVRVSADASRNEIVGRVTPFVDEFPTNARSWLAAERARTDADLSAARGIFERQQRTMSRIAELSTEASVSSELGRLLSTTGFEQWLMVDVLHELAERATDRLLELSGGAYSLLSDGGDFMICDHRNANETRGARTLSGGETFLASMALALALAENISSLATDTGAAPIESIFLDEGFGMLDTETLDVVAAAIEELGASGRMVGVVTHVRELADRLPTRFEVRRTSTSSTVTRVES